MYTDIFSTIFNRTDMEISLYRIVFRIEFDGDVRFCLAPQNRCFYRSVSIFSIFFFNFLLSALSEFLDFFFRAAADRWLSHRGGAATVAVAAGGRHRGSHRRGTVSTYFCTWMWRPSVFVDVNRGFFAFQ